jgi:hypothetical protein
MLEAHIKIDKELASRGWLRAMKFRAIRDISYYYASRLMGIWIVILVVNGLMGAPELNGYHLAALGAVWIGASVWRYLEWKKDVNAMAGWEFDAVLDGASVTVTSDSSATRLWSDYKSLREFEDYLEIEDEQGNFSFLPKHPELSELIEFTKQKIPAKPNF